MIKKQDDKKIVSSCFFINIKFKKITFMPTIKKKKKKKSW